MKKYLLWSSLLTLILSLSTMGTMLYAQNSGKYHPAAPRAQSQDSPQQQAQAFTGEIVKEGDQLVLKDTAANVSYQLDDQSKVKEFVGKNVKIIGTLDTQANMIHVDRVEAIAS